jgi:hypothetical protein
MDGQPSDALVERLFSYHCCVTILTGINLVTNHVQARTMKSRHMIRASIAVWSIHLSSRCDSFAHTVKLHSRPPTKLPFHPSTAHLVIPAFYMILKCSITAIPRAQNTVLWDSRSTRQRAPLQDSTGSFSQLRPFHISRTGHSVSGGV